MDLTNNKKEISDGFPKSITSEILSFICNPPPLSIACRNGDLEEVKNLVENGADVNEGILDAGDGHFEIVKYLVEQGADVNKGIVSAASGGYMDIVKYLLDHGANINRAIKNADTSIEADLLACKTAYEEKSILQDDLREVKHKLPPKNGRI